MVANGESGTCGGAKGKLVDLDDFDVAHGLASVTSVGWDANICDELGKVGKDLGDDAGADWEHPGEDRMEWVGHATSAELEAGFEAEAEDAG